MALYDHFASGVSPTANVTPISHSTGPTIFPGTEAISPPAEGGGTYSATGTPSANFVSGDPLTIGLLFLVIVVLIGAVLWLAV